MTPLDHFSAALLPSGINLVGVISVAEWDAAAPEVRQSKAVAPGARSIIVVGNGGPRMWHALGEAIDAERAALVDQPHPVDAFARKQILAAGAAFAGMSPRWFWAAADATLHLDFRMLAQMAGFGTVGRLGLVMHPKYGSWLGLRSACFVDVELTPTRASGPHPCDGCDAPCITACPGGAFSTGEWGVDACSSFKAASTRCASTCHARLACPAGLDQRYPEQAITYHANRAEGRAALRERFSITSDRFDGVGPHWHDWRKRVDLNQDPKR